MLSVLRWSCHRCEEDCWRALCSLGSFESRLLLIFPAPIWPIYLLTLPWFFSGARLCLEIKPPAQSNPWPKQNQINPATKIRVTSYRWPVVVEISSSRAAEEPNSFAMCSCATAETIARKPTMKRTVRPSRPVSTPQTLKDLRLRPTTSP